MRTSKHCTIRLPLKIFNENLLDPNLGVLRVAVKGKFQGVRQKVQKKKKKTERERKKLEAVRDRFLFPSLGALVIWGYWAQDAGHSRGEEGDKEKEGERKKGRKRNKEKEKSKTALKR